MLDPRKAALLYAIIQEYAQTAEPVGSAVIAAKYRLGVSPATLRSEMYVLESDGYLDKPHTSAGRVPTEKGYRYYVRHLRHEDRTTRGDARSFELALHDLRHPEAVKGIARALAEIAGEMVVVGFGRGEVYCSGIGKLFGKPDIMQSLMLASIAAAIDRLPEELHEAFHEVTDSVHIFIGRENPIDPHCSALFTRYRISGGSGVLGIFGPMRMDYDRNSALLILAKKMLQDF
ncbi:MAG: hypothetical protein AAB562_04690 [Patescibacteria group bacterium]